MQIPLDPRPAWIDSVSKRTFLTRCDKNPPFGGFSSYWEYKKRGEKRKERKKWYEQLPETENVAFVPVETIIRLFWKKVLNKP